MQWQPILPGQARHSTAAPECLAAPWTSEPCFTLQAVLQCFTMQAGTQVPCCVRVLALHKVSSTVKQIAPTYRYAPRSRLRTRRNTYQAGLQGLLVGHEDWVHSVMWQPGVGQQEPCLLSSSMDRTMMLWRRDADTGKASGPPRKAAVKHVGWAMASAAQRGAAVRGTNTGEATQGSCSASRTTVLAAA